MKLFRRSFGEGQPVLILHGLFGSSDNWQTFAKQLSTNNCRVITADLRNHGLSLHAAEFNFDVMSADIKELFVEEGITSAIVMGHSLGGKTAMQFAFQHPERISGLVVIDIAPRQYAVHHRQILDSLLSVNLSSIKSRNEAEEVLAKGIDEPSVVQFLMKSLYRKEKDQFAWRFNLGAINKHIENVGAAVYPVTAFEKKTLFVKGEKSNYISYEDEKEIFDRFTNVEIKTAPGAGHWVHAENPEWLLDEVVRFKNAI
jgi:esterase